MKNKNKNLSKLLTMNALSFSVFMASGQVFALQPLADEALRSVNGQDGVQIVATLTEANIDQLYWEDQANVNGANSTLRATVDNLSIRKSNVSNQNLSADIQINSGSNNNQVGLELSSKVSPLLITTNSFRICENQSSSSCSPAIGSFAYQTTSDTDFSIKAFNGIFNRDSLTELSLGMKNANIYLGQASAGNLSNQLILNNFNYNFKARGVIYVDDVEGLRLQTNTLNGNVAHVAGMNSTPNQNLGYVDLNRVANSASKKSGFINTGTYGNNKSGAEGETTNAGLNIELMTNKNVSTAAQYNLDATTNNPQNAKGLLRLGASGRVVNSYLQFRGTKGPEISATTGTSTNTATIDNVIGQSGIGFRMKADFTKDNDSMLGRDGQASALEIGGAGLNAYGFEFSNLTGLKPNTRASFDTGNMFINLAAIKTLNLPVNDVFQKSRFGNGSFLTALSDYTHNIHNSASANNPNSLIVAIRGGEFQTISRRGRFTNSAGMLSENLIANSTVDNEWGLALPFYNLNANLALYGTTVQANQAFYYTLAGSEIIKNLVATSGETARVGFALAMSTSGVDRLTDQAQGNKTTSILVVDGRKVGTGATATTADYYMGLRNVDMLVKGTGNMGVENGSINGSLRDMLIVMSAEVAAGYLPGTMYKACKLDSGAPGCASRNTAPDNNFALTDDVLFGVKLRVGGDVDFSLIPNSSLQDGNNITFVGELKLKGNNNTIQISDPQNGSTLGLDRITGELGFNNAIVISKDPQTSVGQVGFNTSFRFNPKNNTEGVFRARDINFYPPSTGAGARLGELAITGGRLSSELKITPRN